MKAMETLLEMSSNVMQFNMIATSWDFCSIASHMLLITELYCQGYFSGTGFLHHQGRPLSVTSIWQHSQH